MPAVAAKSILVSLLVPGGGQLAWNLRPFIGSPGLPVQFLRDEPLKGSFYEAVFYSLRCLFLE